MKLKFEYRKNEHAVIVNGIYLIDIPTGTVFYDLDYTGRKHENFPPYIFEIVDLLRQVGIVN